MSRYVGYSYGTCGVFVSTFGTYWYNRTSTVCRLLAYVGTQPCTVVEEYLRFRWYRYYVVCTTRTYDFVGTCSYVVSTTRTYDFVGTGSYVVSTPRVLTNLPACLSNRRSWLVAYDSRRLPGTS